MATAMQYLSLVDFLCCRSSPCREVALSSRAPLRKAMFVQVKHKQWKDAMTTVCLEVPLSGREASVVLDVELSMGTVLYPRSSCIQAA